MQNNASVLDLVFPDKDPSSLPKIANDSWTQPSKFSNVYDLPKGNHSSMNASQAAVTKDLLDARLEATEARMDARVAGMSAKLDTALAEMRADREANGVRFAAMTETFQGIREDIKGVQEQSKSLKSNIWFATATTIATVLAAWALAFSAFDSGRETSKSIAEATARMEKLQAQLEAQAKAAATPPAAGQKN